MFSPSTCCPTLLSTSSTAHPRDLHSSRCAQLVNPGFAGDSATGSLVRASFSPDGQFVVSGSEKGQVRVWDAQGGKRVRTPLQVGS